MARSLFGEILREAAYGAAQGMGATGVDIASRQARAREAKATARRNRREDADDALKQKKFELDKQIAEGKVSPESLLDPAGIASLLGGGSLSPEYASLSGIAPAYQTTATPNAINPQVPPAGGPGGELMGGSPLAAIAMQRDSADLAANGELPPPVRSPQDKMYDYLEQYPVEKLKPEKHSVALKMKGIADEMKNVTTKQGEMELEQQFNDLAREARLESAIIPPPPTAQEELQSRTYIAPDGVAWTQQPTKEGGTRLEASDKPARIELERKRLEQEDLKLRTETEMRLKEAMDQSRVDEETRRKESESMAADQKKQAEEQARVELQSNYDSWNESALKRKPREDRMEAARKKVDADFKAKKLPYTHRDLPAQYIDNVVDKELDTEFQDYLRQTERGKTRAKNAIARTPQQEVEYLAENDPKAWQEKFDDAKRQIGEATGDVNPDPLVVIKAMEDSVANTPARLMARYKEEQIKAELQKKVTTDPTATAAPSGVLSGKDPSFEQGLKPSQIASPADLFRRMGSQRTTPPASDAIAQPPIPEPVATDAIAPGQALQGTEATAQDVQSNPLLRNLLGQQAAPAAEQTIADLIRADAGLPPKAPQASEAMPTPDAAPMQPAGGEITPDSYGDPEDIKAVKDYAKKYKLDPKSITWDEAKQIRDDRDALYGEDAKRDIVMSMIESEKVKDSPAMKRLAFRMKEANLEQKDISRMIDLDVVEYFRGRGSKSPIEDAADAVSGAVANKKLHVSLLDDETRAWVKSRYPVVDPTDPLLESLGPGAKYITPWGEIKKTTRKAPAPRAAEDRQTQAYTSRDQNRERLERQTPR